MWPLILILLLESGCFSRHFKNIPLVFSLKLGLANRGHLILLGTLGQKKKMRSYDMGCDCGKRPESESERRDCQQSAMLEAPDQVHILGDYAWSKTCQQRLDKKDKKTDFRVVGGCAAGHTPWYVYLQIEGGY